MAKRTKKDLGTKTSSDSQADAYPSKGDQPNTPNTRTTPRASRIIAVPLSQLLPDPTQARVILPPDLYRSFYFPGVGQKAINCYQVAEQLLVSARNDQGMQSQVNRLIELGESIMQHGQVEPATGYRDREPSGSEVIRLLVGERRFWSLAIIAVRLKSEEEFTLDVVLKEGHNIGEQLAENLQRDDLSAVDLAKGIASLILTKRGSPPDPNDSKYFEHLREVLSIRKMPAGVWEYVQEHITHTRQHLSRILNVLQFPDDLLYVAAVSKIPEKALRAILEAAPSRWEDLVLAAAKESFTAAELQEAITHQKNPVKHKKTKRGNISVHQKAASRVLSLFKLTNQREFDDKHIEVAGLISAGFEKPKEVAEIGNQLIALGEALLKTAKRRD